MLRVGSGQVADLALEAGRLDTAAYLQNVEAKLQDPDLLSQCLLGAGRGYRRVAPGARGLRAAAVDVDGALRLHWRRATQLSIGASIGSIMMAVDNHPATGFRQGESAP